MPDIFAGISIERDDAGGIEVVAAAGAAQFRIVGAGIADSDIDAVLLLVIDPEYTSCDRFIVNCSGYLMSEAAPPTLAN